MITAPEIRVSIPRSGFSSVKPRKRADRRRTDVVSIPRSGFSSVKHADAGAGGGAGVWFQSRVRDSVR